MDSVLDGVFWSHTDKRILGLGLEKMIYMILNTHASEVELRLVSHPQIGVEVFSALSE